MSVISGTVAALAGNNAAGKQASAAREAGQAQLQATRESIAAQREGADKAAAVFAEQNKLARDFLTTQYDIARQDLAPLRQALSSATALALDPNSPQAEAERNAASKRIERGLSATGTLNSGRAAALYRDVELGLAKQRYDRLAQLGGLGATAGAQLATGFGNQIAGNYQQAGQQIGSLYGNFGQNIGQTLLQGGVGQANSLLQMGQARAAGSTAIANAVSGSINNAVQAGILAKSLGVF